MAARSSARSSKPSWISPTEPAGLNSQNARIADAFDTTSRLDVLGTAWRLEAGQWVKGQAPVIPTWRPRLAHADNERPVHLSRPAPWLDSCWLRAPPRQPSRSSARPQNSTTLHLECPTWTSSSIKTVKKADRGKVFVHADVKIQGTGWVLPRGTMKSGNPHDRWRR